MIDINLMDNKISTIGIFAHANAGKTTLTEQILYKTGIVKSVGRVDTGDTTTDSMSIEQDRGISIKSSLVTFDIEDKHIQLIDTPGHIDFSAEVERAINVLDGAVLVLSGVEGVESQTYTIWKALKKRNIPVIVFINKMDRLGADYNKVISDIKINIENAIIPINKIHNKKSKVGIETVDVDTLANDLSKYDSGTTNYLLESENNADGKWIQKRLRQLVRDGLVYPVLAGAALQGIGINNLLRAIYDFLPNYNCNKSNEFSAVTYLAKVNGTQTKQIYAKILSGSLSLRDIVELKNEANGKATELYKINGNIVEAVKDARCGEIIIVTGLNAKPGEMIGAQSNDYNCVSFIKPLIKVQIELQDIGKEQEFANVLQILNIEDPYLDVQHNDIGISISLMGKMQADTLTTMIKERFNLTVKFSNTVIIHKESPSQIGIGMATYTEFSGIEIEVEPSKHGSGLSYESVISTGYLHKKYQKQAMRLLKEYSKNCLFGWGLTDAIIRIKDGRFNSAGSKSLHFNIAVPIAFMRALKKSDIRLLEPIMEYKIVVPEQYKKGTINWISQKSAVFEIMENTDYCTIIGKAPATTLLNAHTELLGLTKGFGVLFVEFVEYSLTNSNDQRNVQCSKNSVSSINEILFVVNKMDGSVDLLGNKLTKKKRASKSKFRRVDVR